MAHHELAHAPPHQRLRHPAEIPFFAFMVILNILVIAVILRATIIVPFLPEPLQHSALANTVRGALIGLLLLLPGLIIVRETQRASVGGTAIQLSEQQFPSLYKTAEEFASALGLSRRPDIFLTNGNGALNAFAAQATGHDYVVLSNELFANLYQDNREGLRFIIGHEMGHIRLHHVALWYQLSIAYSERIPILGPSLSRLREYSCDRHGASLCPGPDRPSSMLGRFGTCSRWCAFRARSARRSCPGDARRVARRSEVRHRGSRVVAGGRCQYGRHLQGHARTARGSMGHARSSRTCHDRCTRRLASTRARQRSHWRRP